MTVATATNDTSSGGDPVIRIGRVALATQGILYVIVGFLAVQVSGGDRDAKPSQKGALENLARQPYGRVLLIVVALGLATHSIWRLLLALRGEPGDDEDSGSVAKRVAHVGRAAIYASFTYFAIRLLVGAESASEGAANEQRSTAIVMGWPGGRILVVVVGSCIIASGVWNGYKAVTRKFDDNLDLSGLDEAKAKGIKAAGVAGYLARGVAFALIGWFLITAGWAKNAGKTEGLDGALRNLAASSHGHLWLFIVAIGLMFFGAYRVLDGVFRKPSEIAHS